MAIDFTTLKQESSGQAPGPLVFDFATAQKQEAQGVDFSSIARVSDDPSVDQTIRDAAKGGGVDEITLLAIASVESGLDPKAQNPNSSAGGLFQFIDDTWKDVAGEGADKFNAKQNAEAGAEFTKRNIAGLKAELGRDPTLEETYMAHFLGLGGAKDTLKKLQENPEALAKDVFSESVRKSNPNIFKEGATAQEAMDRLTSKVTAAAKKFN